MTEPQLSAEMDRKFDNEFPYTVEKYTAVAKSFKHFLATALEEQKQELLSEIKNRKATIKWLWGKQKTDDECFLMVMEQVQRIAEFSKLNQLKGGK